MSLSLDALTGRDVLALQVLRNQHREGLRTPSLTTEGQQERFLADVIENPHSPHRYWALRDGDTFRGMVGLTYIEWENGLAEISLITTGERGIGSTAVELCLSEAFDRMRLLTVCGECFTCNPALSFWKKMVGRYQGQSVILPRRKFWDGRLHDAYWFCFTVEGWK